MSPVIELHEPEVVQEEVQKKGAPTLAVVKASVELLDLRFFSDVLLEADTASRRRRKWAAISSVLMQGLILGVLLIIPLWFTEALPRQQLLTFLIAPPPPPPPPPAAAAPAIKIVRQVQSDVLDGHLRAPSRIPQKVQMIKEEEAPPPMVSGTGVVGGVSGGIPGGQLGGVIGGIIGATSNLSSVPKLAAPEPPKRMRISQGVTRGMRVFSPQPAYPKIAQAARISGDVVLTAIISRSGEIQNLTVLSGHPLLVPAALKAVEQWRYRPFLLNDQPIEVETTITVSFKFNYQ